jgi:stage V sporulation protein G
MSDAARGTAEQGGQKLDMSVKVYPTQDSRNLLATATVTLGGCFAIRGIRILDSEKGAFVSMPQRKTAQGEYKDICFPTTAEMRKELHSAVLGEYQRTMEQSFSRAEKAMEKRGSVLDTLSQKAAEARPPTPGKAKAADKGER